MSEFHTTYEWQRIRSRVMRMYGGLCANPFGVHTNIGMITPNGKPTMATVVHHIVPIEVDVSLSRDMHNLVPLCQTCHELAHELLATNRKAYREAFGLDAIISLTPRQSSIQPQQFFAQSLCRRVQDGWLCARTGRVMSMRCSTCQTRADGETGGSEPKNPNKSHLTSGESFAQ